MFLGGEGGGGSTDLGNIPKKNSFLSASLKSTMLFGRALVKVLESGQGRLDVVKIAKRNCESHQSMY